MTIDIEAFNSEVARLRRVVEEERGEQQRAQGRYEATMSSLKEEFGVDSLGEAKKTLTSLGKKRISLAKELEELVESLEELEDAIKS